MPLAPLDDGGGLVTGETGAGPTERVAQAARPQVEVAVRLLKCFWRSRLRAMLLAIMRGAARPFRRDARDRHLR